MIAERGRGVLATRKGELLWEAAAQETSRYEVALARAWTLSFVTLFALAVALPLWSAVAGGFAALAGVLALGAWLAVAARNTPARRRLRRAHAARVLDAATADAFYMLREAYEAAAQLADLHRARLHLDDLDFRGGGGAKDNGPLAALHKAIEQEAEARNARAVADATDAQARIARAGRDRGGQCRRGGGPREGRARRGGGGSRAARGAARRAPRVRADGLHPGVVDRALGEAHARRRRDRGA